MTALPKVDVVLLGIGAAGGIAAHVLTKAGLRVVAIEVGEERSNADFVSSLDELAGSTALNPMGDALVNRTVPRWRPDPDTPVSDPPGIYPTMNGVGGTSIHYGGVSWRLQPGDFRARSATMERYGEKALPEGTTLADWPVGYDELEPYYDRVETLVGVSGEPGPHDGKRSQPFVMPPLRRKGWNDFAAKGLARQGYAPFAQPAAVNSVPYGGRAACSYCGFCSGFGCWNDSKGSTLVTAIPLARSTGRLDVRSQCRVTRIEVDDHGRASGVRYVDASGVEAFQPAGVVIMGMFVYENVRRLLLSKSARFPDGLANNGGQVGRHFMTHTYVIVNGQYDGIDVRAMTGLGAQATVIDEFYGDVFDHAGLGFIRGASIATFAESRPIGAAMAKPPGVASWGAGYKSWLRDGLRSVCGFYAQMEVLPYEQNRIDLDPDAKDPWGDPLLRITYAMQANEKRMADFLEGKLAAMHKGLGASTVWTALKAPTTPYYSHVFGGVRMGTDPATSVVDALGIAHEVPNLAVLGGALFPTSSGRNPTETIQALAWRTAEYIAANFRAITA